MLALELLQQRSVRICWRCSHNRPLQTRSCVVTCVPSSMVCKVKSISGTGFFSRIALIVLAN